MANRGDRLDGNFDGAKKGRMSDRAFLDGRDLVKKHRISKWMVETLKVARIHGLSFSSSASHLEHTGLQVTTHDLGNKLFLASNYTLPA